MRTVYSAVLAAVVVVSCFMGRSAPVTARPIAIDTTVVILRIYNYQPESVRVLLIDMADSSSRKVGDVTARHEAFFVVPSSEIPHVVLFRVLVIPESPRLKPYRTGGIVRNTTKITMVFVAVGTDAFPDSASAAVRS